MEEQMKSNYRQDIEAAIKTVGEGVKHAKKGVKEVKEGKLDPKKKEKLKAARGKAVTNLQNMLMARSKGK